MSKTATNRRAHFEALVESAATYRGRITAGTDWVRAIAADLPLALRPDGLDRVMRLVRELEEMEGRDDDAE